LANKEAALKKKKRLDLLGGGQGDGESDISGVNLGGAGGGHD